MSYLEKLKNCKTTSEFANLLGFKPSMFSYIIYKIPNDKKYSVFSIPKKSGGERQIKAPVPQLKELQRRIANIMNECAEEITINRKHPNPRKKYKSLSHGFKKNHSIATNATQHKNQRYVLNLDLENFFPSFNFGRVRGFFIKNNDFLLSEKIATLVAQIACHNNELPQGSPCSPIITNLITHVLDIRLVQLARKYGCTYSRYADDITFSTNQVNFPKELSIKVSDESSDWVIIAELEKTIAKAGFAIKHSKTRMQYQESRQTVTGLVVNSKVNVKNEYYRYARSMCHTLFQTGEFFFYESKIKGTLSQLNGILSHIHYIRESSITDSDKEKRNKEREKAKKEQRREKLNSSNELFSKFLFYKHFVALEKPLILSEGKTDIDYLKCAITQLKKGVSPLNDEINFFRNTKLVREIMRIHEGAASLKNFMEFYVKETDFKHKPLKHPVIVLLDNDQEAEKAVNFIKGKYFHPNVNYDRSQTNWYHVVDNLYLVLMPKISGKDSKIEDFFDSKVLDIEVGGKKFNPKNTSSGDDDGKFGKHWFVTKVIKPNQNNIDFSKFKPILLNIALAINDYKKNTSFKT